MNFYPKELLWSFISIIFLIACIQITKNALRKFSVIRHIDPNRKKAILSFSYLLYCTITGSAFAIIWGVDLEQFTIFMSSVLAVLGVAFVAQWSLLSNLTASIILFFYHPLRIGDRIRVLDPDFDWTGELVDITGFYLFIETDTGEHITLPNSLVVQKGIQMLGKETKTDVS